MIYKIKKTPEEINDLLNACVESEATEKSKFPGMSYEEGVKYALEWVLGISDVHPLQD